MKLGDGHCVIGLLCMRATSVSTVWAEGAGLPFPAAGAARATLPPLRPWLGAGSWSTSRDPASIPAKRVVMKKPSDEGPGDPPKGGTGLANLNEINRVGGSILQKNSL